MSWLAAIAKGILDALLNWGQKQAEKPKTTEDAKTPENVRSDWNRYIADKLRDKNSSGH
jgi:hypothetical protein